MTKKIILLLVEGPSDADSLALIFSRLTDQYNLQFDVMHGDITADENTTVKYIERIIQEKIDRYLNRNPFIKRDDILKVIQIIDTDGAFVPNSKVLPSDSGKTEYHDTCIKAKDKDRMIRRNISKRAIVHYLAKMKKLSDSIRYEIYYFSRNLEHVLHDSDARLSTFDKEDMAYEVADYYGNKPKEFLKFLYEGEFYVPGTYDETWKFIMNNGNSLKRLCNIHIFFEKLGIKLDD